MQIYSRQQRNPAANSTAASPPRGSFFGPNPTVLAHFAAAVLLMVPQPCISGDDQGFRLSREDVVSIRADTAWEDIEPDTVHFEGNFRMQVRDWLVLADRATLQGKLDDPDRVTLEGSPARLELSYTLGERKEIVRGEAGKIVYDRETAQIRLSGDARMGQDDKMLHSSEIDYDINTDRFRTQGATGINVRVDPENQEPLPDY
jgi:lipopolysaccharide transport protein LptA